MNFARKQLEKYGWTDGKGLGKHENGISQALKPKLKRSVAGIGYDAASDFTEHWWSALYDKAAGNVEVEEKNGKTKKMKRKEDKEFEITNSTWKLKHKRNDDSTQKYTDFFVSTAILDGGKSKTTKVNDSESDSEVKDATKLTDEELFAACQGRTAHKGARHGLRALGKLARIEQQEQLLLQQDKYNSYLHKKKNNADDSQVVEDASLNDDVDVKRIKRKKKKRCNSRINEINNDNCNDDLSQNIIDIEQSEETQIKQKHECVQDKTKKKKRKHIKDVDETIEKPEIQDDTSLKKKKKKK